MKKLLRAVLYFCLDIWGTVFFTNFCPLCEHFVASFIDGRDTEGQSVVNHYKIVSMGKRPHYRCPRCNSSDKERLVWLFLTVKLGITDIWKPFNVLHIAPEKTTQRRLLRLPNIAYTAGDMFEGDARYTKDRYKNTEYMDITDLSKFSDNTFDLIICNHVLEHVPDDKKGMTELYRVLKSGGTAILNVPVSRVIDHTIEEKADTDEERLKLFGQHDHVRIYQEKDYITRLESVGFTVSPKGLRDITMPNNNTFGVNVEEKVYVCTK